MSSANTFLQQQLIKSEALRREAQTHLVSEQNALRARYQQQLDRIDAGQERTLAFMEPLLAHLENMPDDIAISSMAKNSSGSIDILLNTFAGASLANLLLEHPPIPFSLDSIGSMRAVDVQDKTHPAYSGILIDQNGSSLHWQSMLGDDAVNFTCNTDAVSVDAWQNPVDTGVPLASIALGDVATTSTWCSMGYDGSNYWIQPSNEAAADLLHAALSWKNNKTLLASLKEDFHQRVSEFPALSSPQARIVLNALFVWATSSERMPVPDDFSAWTPPKGNVLVMHAAQDWIALGNTVQTQLETVGGAQSKIERLSRHLPNIWRFVGTDALGVVCSAMAETQKRWLANQKSSLSMTP